MKNTKNAIVIGECDWNSLIQKRMYITDICYIEKTDEYIKCYPAISSEWILEKLDLKLYVAKDTHEYQKLTLLIEKYSNQFYIHKENTRLKTPLIKLDYIAKQMTNAIEEIVFQNCPQEQLSFAINRAIEAAYSKGIGDKTQELLNILGIDKLINRKIEENNF